MSYSYVGGGSTNDGNPNIVNFTITIPAGFIVVGCIFTSYTTGTGTAQTSDGTNLHLDFLDGDGAGFFSGTIGASTSITVTSPVPFGNIAIDIWSFSTPQTLVTTATGLYGAALSGTLSGDSAFAVAVGANSNWASSVPVPTNTHTAFTENADWIVTGTSINAINAGGIDVAAADYRPSGAAAVLFAQACL